MYFWYYVVVDSNWLDLVSSSCNGRVCVTCLYVSCRWGHVMVINRLFGGAACYHEPESGLTPCLDESDKG